MVEEQITSQNQQQEAEASFFAREERILSDIAGGSVFKFRRGNQWAIDPETGEATYDPKFFQEKGYTPSQALFASFHEIRAHLVEHAQILSDPKGEKIFQRLKQRSEKKRRIHLWENVRQDIKGNLSLLRIAPSLSEQTQRLYREKLFPVTDMTQVPKHLQLIDAIIRRAMVPGEEVKVSPEVEEEIKKLRNIKGKDVIELATDPNQDPVLALQLSEKYIEPVIDKLFEQDKEENKKKQDKDKDKQGGEGESGDQSQPSTDPFEEEYDKREEAHPEPMDEKELEKKIKETIKAADLANREDKAYEREHGVSKKDTADYYSEYAKIQNYIEPLRQVFRRIIQERTIPKRRLGSLKEEGVMVDPGLVTQTYLEIKGGAKNPKTMKDFEGFIVPEDIPASFSIHLVADQSGSMGDGEKHIFQRRAAILLMEALKEFSDFSESVSENLVENLDIQTELRSFGNYTDTQTRTYKPLSAELTEKQRIEYFKGLLEISGGTNDYDSLAEIEQELKQRMENDSQYAQELKSGRKREIVIVLSDGQSNSPADVQQRLKVLRGLGVKVVGVGISSDGSAVLNTYAPDAKVANRVSDLPETIETLLEEFLSDLSVANLNDMLRLREQ